MGGPAGYGHICFGNPTCPSGWEGQEKGWKFQHSSMPRQALQCQSGCTAGLEHKRCACADPSAQPCPIHTRQSDIRAVQSSHVQPDAGPDGYANFVEGVVCLKSGMCRYYIAQIGIHTKQPEKAQRGMLHGLCRWHSHMLPMLMSYTLKHHEQLIASQCYLHEQQMKHVLGTHGRDSECWCRWAQSQIMAVVAHTPIEPPRPP